MLAIHNKCKGIVPSTFPRTSVYGIVIELTNWLNLADCSCLPLQHQVLLLLTALMEK